MRLHGALGGEQPFGDQRLPVLEALGRHRHRDGDGIAERVLQATPAAQMPSVCSSRSNATPLLAHGFEIGEQGVEARERLRRARLVSAADQRLDAPASLSCAR